MHLASQSYVRAVRRYRDISDISLLWTVIRQRKAHLTDGAFFELLKLKTEHVVVIVCGSKYPVSLLINEVAKSGLRKAKSDDSQHHKQVF